MSEQETLNIAELAQLEKELRAGAQPRQSVQLVNNSPPWLPVGAAIADPNHVRADIEHPSPVLDRLRAAIADPNTDPADREAAREVLRISFPWARD